MRLCKHMYFIFEAFQIEMSLLINISMNQYLPLSNLL